MRSHHLTSVMRNVVSRPFAPQLAICHFLCPFADDLPRGLVQFITAQKEHLLGRISTQSLMHVKQHAELDCMRSFHNSLWVHHGWRRCIGHLMEMGHNPSITEVLVGKLADFGRVIAKTKTRTVRDENETIDWQIAVCRELFAPHAVPLANARSWLTPNGQNLLKTIRDECHFSMLKQLVADLEAAGCDDDILLDHCESDRQHLAGCWVVETLYQGVTCPTTG